MASAVLELAARDLHATVGLRERSRGDANGNRIDFEGWMQIRTGGPDQPAADAQAEERLRRRHYFVTSLVVRK